MKKHNVSSSSASKCQLSCGYYFSSGFVISETIYSSNMHGALYNAASRIIIDGGKKVLHTAALGGMLAQNFTMPVYADIIVSPGETSSGLTGDTVSVYGTTVNDIVSAGLYEYVYSGGLANITTVSSGGHQIILNSGTASGAIVSTGGYQDVSSGGITSRTVLSSGAVQNVYNGGIANRTSVLRAPSNTRQVIYSGGIANDTFLSFGRQQVSSGAIASGTSLYMQGFQDVLGGTAIGTIIRALGYQSVFSGSAVDNIVSSGGSQFVTVSGTANGT